MLQDNKPDARVKAPQRDIYFNITSIMVAISCAEDIKFMPGRAPETGRLM